ncbi:FkbM family methyltransferase [Phytoactinopolyspora mesophila]|nr:FkbM family methyltransferase [Phytoactinopolyspora mesophila]
MKALVKRILSWRVPHYLVRVAATLAGGRIRRERLPAPAHVKSVEARMAGVSFVMNRPDRCIIAKELYWGRGVRPRSEDQLALDVFATVARDSKLVLDLGAYTGIFSLLAARASEDADVHAFEVLPEVAKAALDNVVANDLLTRITIHTEGVGKDGDSACLETGTGGSALPDFYSTEFYFEKGVHVPIRSLDSIFEAFPESARGAKTAMKIDVEGTEDVVLQHAQVFLAANRPDIVCEVLPGRANTAGVEAALRPHGYRFFRFGEQALTEHEDLIAQEPFRDWLFTTKTADELRAVGVSVNE